MPCHHSQVWVCSNMLLFDIEVMFEHDRNMGILEKFMHQLGYSTALYRLRRIVRVHTRVEDGSA